MGSSYWDKQLRGRFSRRGMLRGTAIGAAGLTSWALVGCGEGNGGSTAQPTRGLQATEAPNVVRKKGGILRYGQTPFTALDPNVSPGGNDWPAEYAIYDTLLDADSNGVLVPKIVEKWEITGDQLTLKLRPNVKFHDGNPFDAPALKASVERTLGLGAKSRIYSQWSQVESIQAPDATTAVLKLVLPQFAPFLANLTSISGCIPSPKAVEARGEDFSLNPVGAGPFRFKSINTDSLCVLEANPDYWGSPEHGPYLDGVEFRCVANTTALLTAMQAGEIDNIHYVTEAPAAEVEQLRRTAGVTILQAGGRGFQEFRLHCGKFPFDNPDLLKAFAYAIDREALLTGLNLGKGTIAGGPINHETWAFDPTFVGFAIEKKEEREAKVVEHLTRGGHPGGFEFEAWVPTAGGPTVPRAEAVAQQVAKFGIVMKTTPNPNPPGLQYLYDGNFQALPSATPMYTVDPDSIFRPQFHTKGQFAYHRFGNAKFDAMLDNAAVKTDQEERTALYAEIQKTLHEMGIPRTPTIFPDVLIPLSEKVKGYAIDWSGYLRVGTIWLDA